MHILGSTTQEKMKMNGMWKEVFCIINFVPDGNVAILIS